MNRSEARPHHIDKRLSRPVPYWRGDSRRRDWPGFAIAAIATLALSTGSWAGVSEQGTSEQGTSEQGTLLVSGLEGRRFFGSLLDRSTRETLMIELKSFRGDLVDIAVLGSPRRRMIVHAEDLVGLEWATRVCGSGPGCVDVGYRIASAARDETSNTMPGHSSNGDVWLYEVEYTTAENPAPEDWKNVCGDDAGGPIRGIFVDGRWHPDGSHSPRGYTFSCPRGVIAKCARSWGYKPWKTLVSADHGPVDLQPLHQACTRAARADYCGNGVPHTRDGTLIDMFDGYGFNVREPGMGFTEESAFDGDGARWVRRPRYPTGEAGDEGWFFPGCERPYEPDSATLAAEPALLHVYSAPDLTL